MDARALGTSAATGTLDDRVTLLRREGAQIDRRDVEFFGIEFHDFVPLHFGGACASRVQFHTLPYGTHIGGALALVNTAPYGSMMKKQTKAPVARRNAAVDPRIGPTDWVRAGLSMLAREGIDAVRVEPLADVLGVTKGSFYWHFKDRAALHAAMLVAWRDAATREIIRQVDAENLTARRRLNRLIELTTSNAKAARLETAIRSWAQVDPTVGKVLASADAERLAYVAALLRGTGMESSTADMRANILYLILIGSFFAASKSELESGPELWREIAKLIL